MSDDPHRILVIDDKPDNLRVAVDLLEAHGFKALTANNGERGIKRAKARPPALILLDVQMPGIDGYEATRQLRAWETESPEADRHLPVVALTAHAMTGDREKCLDAGMDDYLSKPFTEARLEKTLRRWLDSSHSATR